MKELGTIIEVFPKARSTSLLRKGIAKLDGGRVIEFSGVFSKAEEKVLQKGKRVRGYIGPHKILRNTELHEKSP
jgi:hypothetical protein